MEPDPADAGGSLLTVRLALEQARQQGVDRLDAQWLLMHLLGQHAGHGRAWLMAHEDHGLSLLQTQAWQRLLQRRAAGEPLAYVTGEREFCGLALRVSPHVLVPRPETEVLVDWALHCWRAVPAPTVVDLGAGSGAIALALRHHLPSAQVWATDVSADALAVARCNADRLGLPVHLAQGHWWQAVAGHRFGLAVSNPPYIADADPHLAALTHEPPLALTSGPDGLQALREIVADAPQHLLPGAWLLMEHGHDQAPAVRALMTEQGFETPRTRTDLAGLPRCTGARWPGVP